MKDRPDNEAAGPTRRPATTDDAHDNVHPSVSPPADSVPYSTRRPCATVGCANDRPLVPVGCAAFWDRCYRCTRRTLTGRPYPPVGEMHLDHIDPWSERVHELLAAAEMAGAGWPA